MDLQALEANYQPMQLSMATQQQPAHHQVNPWISILPSALAAGASFVPGVGTGGAVLLGGGGELARELLSGEKVDARKIGTEAAISAIPGGLGKLGKTARLVKGSKTAAKAAKELSTASKAAELPVHAAEEVSNVVHIPVGGGAPTPNFLSLRSGLKDPTPEAMGLRADLGASAQQPAKAAPATMAPPEIVKETPVRRSSLLSRYQQTDKQPSFTSDLGSKLRANVRGVRPGDKIPGTKEILDKTRANEINTAINDANRGAIPSTVRGQLERVQNARDDVGRTIGNLTEQHNIPLTHDHVQEVSGHIEKHLAKLTGIKKPTPEIQALADNYSEDIAGAKNLSELERVRRGIAEDAKNFLADPLKQGTKTGQVARAFYRGIDNFVSGVSPQLKVAKTQYSRLETAEDILAKKADPKGIMPFGTNINGKGLGGGTMQAIQEGAGKTLEAAGSDKKPPSYIRALIPQTIVHGAMGGQADMPTPQDGAAMQPSQPLEGDLIDAGASGMGGAGDMPAPQDDLSQKFQQAMLQDLAETGGKNIDKLATIAKFMGVDPTASSKAGKPMSAEAAKVVSNAHAGLQAIDDFQGLVQQDPEAFNRTNIPGVGLLDKFTQGRASGALGTSGIDAASQQIIDVIARLRTGAAISAAEEQRFKKFIPLPGDPPDTRDQKLNYLAQQFQFVAQRAGSAGNDTQSAILNGAVAQ